MSISTLANQAHSKSAYDGLEYVEGSILKIPEPWNRCKKVVKYIFQDVRAGREVNILFAWSVVKDISDAVACNSWTLLRQAKFDSPIDDTYVHSVSVCALMLGLSRAMKLDEETIKLAGLAGLLHDVGKAVLPYNLLHKPSKLSPIEFDALKAHPVLGGCILQTVPNLDPEVLDVCLHHHEKVDGTGYPKGLQGADISLLAKMCAVCDVYDAITSTRSYKDAWCPVESLEKMTEWVGSHFDDQVFLSFKNMIENWHSIEYKADTDLTSIEQAVTVNSYGHQYSEAPEQVLHVFSKT
jgi:HD-GYP domain-containing protein (c-di-GMP phosphodiesterase class II)